MGGRKEAAKEGKHGESSLTNQKAHNERKEGRKDGRKYLYEVGVGRSRRAEREVVHGRESIVVPPTLRDRLHSNAFGVTDLARPGPFSH